MNHEGHETPMTYVPLQCQQHYADNVHTHEKRLRFVVLSDTHNTHDDFEQLPRGDILIHTGDFTKWGMWHEVSHFAQYLKRQLQFFRHIVVIPGNHEFFPDMAERCFYGSSLLLGNGLDASRVHYLLDRTITIEGVTIYGTRFKPHSYFNWVSPRGRDSDAKTCFNDALDAVSAGSGVDNDDSSSNGGGSDNSSGSNGNDTNSIVIGGGGDDDRKVDIVLSHQPPRIHMSSTSKSKHDFRFRRGNGALADVVMKLNPSVHVFGHCHEAFGYVHAQDCDVPSHMKTTFISAPSIYGMSGEGRRPPIVFDFIPGQSDDSVQ